MTCLGTQRNALLWGQEMLLSYHSSFVTRKARDRGRTSNLAMENGLEACKCIHRCLAKGKRKDVMVCDLDKPSQFSMFIFLKGTRFPPQWGREHVADEKTRAQNQTILVHFHQSDMCMLF